MTKRTVKLLLNDNFFVLAFYHLRFDTLTASSFLAAYQKYRFSEVMVEKIAAELTLEVRILRGLHNCNGKFILFCLKFNYNILFISCYPIDNIDYF
jgi:hypothetical protein